MVNTFNLLLHTEWVLYTTYIHQAQCQDDQRPEAHLRTHDATPHKRRIHQDRRPYAVKPRSI